MNSLPILIIGAPCVLAVIAERLSARQKKTAPKIERVENWTWPKKWRPVAKTGEK